MTFLPLVPIGFSSQTRRIPQALAPPPRRAGADLPHPRRPLPVLPPAAALPTAADPPAPPLPALPPAAALPTSQQKVPKAAGNGDNEEVMQWRDDDPGFEMLPPKLERSAGRPKVKRIKSRAEPGKRGPYQCKRCFKFGHIEKGCSEPPTELDAELPPSLPSKSGKRKGEAATSKSKKASKKSKVGAASTSTSIVAAPVSPGVITRRMASSTSTPSPGPTTRRMAAQLDISPGGISRRRILN